jgi:hypothetical protein
MNEGQQRELLALDHRIEKMVLSDPKLEAAEERLDLLVKEADPVWLTRAELMSRRRYRVVLESPCLDWAGAEAVLGARLIEIIGLAADGPQMFESCLRRADADALVASVHRRFKSGDSLPHLSVRPEPTINRLVALEHLLPGPHRWFGVDPPRFNRTAHLRRSTGFYPRRHLDEGLGRLGTTSDREPSFMFVGTPVLAVVFADEENWAIFDYAFKWEGPHEGRTDLTHRRSFATSELPSDSLAVFEHIRVPLEQAIAERRARFSKCKRLRSNDTSRARSQR